LADAGRALFYQFGVGLAFLATIRPDGGPRVHPVCPYLTDDELYMFVSPSLKRNDLHRDGRYALHSYPCPDSEDAFYVFGNASVMEPGADESAARSGFLDERNWTDKPPPDRNEQQIFKLSIERALYARTTGHGDFAPAAHCLATRAHELKTTPIRVVTYLTWMRTPLFGPFQPARSRIGSPVSSGWCSRRITLIDGASCARMGC
jgi:hypothetical protein